MFFDITRCVLRLMEQKMLDCFQFFFRIYSQRIYSLHHQYWILLTSNFLWNQGRFWNRISLKRFFCFHFLRTLKLLILYHGLCEFIGILSNKGINFFSFISCRNFSFDFGNFFGHSQFIHNRHFSSFILKCSKNIVMTEDQKIPSNFFFLKYSHHSLFLRFFQQLPILLKL